MHIVNIRIKIALIKNNVTIKDLAKQINLSPRTIYNYCSGRTRPTVQTLIRICQALGESSDYLLGLVD